MNAHPTTASSPGAESRWCIDDAHLSRLYSPSAWNFNPEWSPILEDDTKSLWRRFPMPFSSSGSESHLDFDSDDSDEEDGEETTRRGGKADAGNDDSFSDDCSDRDSDEISFVLRESARALIEDVEFRDPVVHYETSWRSTFESTVLDTLDDQLKNDPRASWTAICWRDAAPEDVPVPQPSDQDESTLRPHTARLLLTTALNTQIVRRPVASHSPVTPGDPILGGTPPLSMTPRSPVPRRSPVGFPTQSPPTSPPFVDSANAIAIAAPVPRYRPMSDPPPYSASASPGTWTEFSSSANSFAEEKTSSSPFTSTTSEASDADNEASTDDDSSDSRTFTERSSDFDSSSDRRSNSDPSLPTTASTTAASRRDVSSSSSSCPSPSPAPSSFLLPHAYSFSAALAAKYSSSPSICGVVATTSASARASPAPSPLRRPEPSSLTVPVPVSLSTGHTPPSSNLSSPLDRHSLPFPLFTVPNKPSEAVHFAPERPTSPPALSHSHHHNHHHHHKSPLFFHHTHQHPKSISGTWKAGANANVGAPSVEDSTTSSSALQRFASRCGTLSRKLTSSVSAGGIR